MVRIVIGIIIIAVCALILSSVIMMTGYEFNTDRGWQRMPSAVSAIGGFPTLALIFVGGWVMGRQYWQQACGWALLGVTVFCLMALGGMSWSLNSPEAAAMMEAMSAEQGVPMPETRIAWTTPLVLLTVLAVTGIALVLAGHRRTVASGERPDPDVRPVVVTAYAVFIIVTSVLGLLGTVWNFYINPMGMREYLADYSSVPAAILWLQSGLVILAQVVFAVFLLKRRNWARWGMVALLLLGMLVAFFTMGHNSWLLPCLAWLGFTVACLFIPSRVNAWFRGGRGEVAA